MSHLARVAGVAHVIVTRSDLLSKDRDLVARFTGAALKALRYTLDPGP